MEMDERSTAAAMWGSSENVAYPLVHRLNFAQNALGYYGNRANWLDEEMEEVDLEVYLVTQSLGETSPSIKKVDQSDPEEWAANMAEDYPDQFHFFAAKTVLVPVDVL